MTDTHTPGETVSELDKEFQDRVEELSLTLRGLLRLMFDEEEREYEEDLWRENQ